jgi:hypothetical protein
MELGLRDVLGITKPEEEWLEDLPHRSHIPMLAQDVGWVAGSRDVDDHSIVRHRLSVIR